MEKDRIKNTEGQGHCQLRRDEVLLKRKQLHVENTVGKVIHLDTGKYNPGKQKEAFERKEVIWIKCFVTERALCRSHIFERVGMR